MLIIVVNIVIGIVQEIRAKKTIEKLSLLTAPTVKVVRNGEEENIAMEEVVIDDIVVLEKAIELNPSGAKAYYYLGCLNYDRFNYDKAIALWEGAIACDPAYAKALRNLALAYFDKKQDYMGAKVCMEKAMEYLPSEPRLLMEYQ